MKGVMAPSASPGSSQRAASVTCTAHVICPSGAAAAGEIGSANAANREKAATIQVSRRMWPSRDEQPLRAPALPAQSGSKNIFGGAAAAPPKISNPGSLEDHSD